jgi:hypothetical protein
VGCLLCKRVRRYQPFTTNRVSLSHGISVGLAAVLVSSESIPMAENGSMLLAEPDPKIDALD